MEKEYKIVDSIEALNETIRTVKQAQEQFAKYSQEQVDKIFLAAALAANQSVHEFDQYVCFFDHFIRPIKCTVRYSTRISKN